jgi:hypothetical protein
VQRIRMMEEEIDAGDFLMVVRNNYIGCRRNRALASLPMAIW